MADPPGVLAALVCAARARGGWSRYDLARRAATARETISNIEVGRVRRPQRRTLRRLAAALGVPVEDPEAAADRDALRPGGGEG